MATMQFTVWSVAAEVANGPVLNENVVTIGGGSLQSGVMDSNGGNRNRRVRVACDINAWVTWGSNPTALADGTEGRMMFAENAEYFDIKANEKLAVIAR